MLKKVLSVFHVLSVQESHPNQRTVWICASPIDTTLRPANNLIVLFPDPQARPSACTILRVWERDQQFHSPFPTHKFTKCGRCKTRFQTSLTLQKKKERSNLVMMHCYCTHARYVHNWCITNLRRIICPHDLCVYCPDGISCVTHKYVYRLSTLLSYGCPIVSDYSSNYTIQSWNIHVWVSDQRLTLNHRIQFPTTLGNSNPRYTDSTALAQVLPSYTKKIQQFKL